MGRCIFAIAVGLFVGCGDAHVGNALIDGGAVDADTSCDGLDVPTCRATAGCVADFCSDCTCGQAYSGCRPQAEAPDECPPLICPEPGCCSGAEDCDVSRECLRPGEMPPCGARNDDPGDCSIDKECNQQAGEICDPIPCSSIGAFQCVPGCQTSTDCATGTECNPEHRCTSRPCDESNPCPTDFHCDESFCARDACQLDVDCAGFCVEGLCFADLGVCTPPAP